LTSQNKPIHLLQVSLFSYLVYNIAPKIKIKTPDILVWQNFCQDFQFFDFFFEKSWDFQILIMISWRFCFSRRNNFLSSGQLFLVAIVFKIPNLKFHLRNFLNFFLFQHNSDLDQLKGRARGKELIFLLLLALQVLKKAFLTSLLIVCGHFCVLLHTLLHCIFLSAHFWSAYLFC